jgi:hypothetical protein
MLYCLISISFHNLLFMSLWRPISSSTTNLSTSLDSLIVTTT